MALPIKCCPVGYTYVNIDGYYLDPSTNTLLKVNNYISRVGGTYDKCYKLQGGNTYDTPLDSITCGCCPAGYSVVNSNGYVISGSGSVFLVGTTYAGKCMSWSNFDSFVDSGDCPCCPPGYVYFSLTSECITENLNNLGPGKVATIPCIDCLCDDVVPPPNCEDCDTNQGLPVHFTLDNTVKQCQSCITIGEPCYPGGANKLVAIELLDPIINFILRS